jgi:hypothetical protein
MKDLSLFKENYGLIISILTVLSFIAMKKSLMEVRVDYIVLRNGFLYRYYIL